MIERKAGERSGMLAAGALVALPLLLFYGLLTWFATILPNEDDYHALFGFALRWQHTSGWWQRVMLIVTSQHNEYKMFVEYVLLGLQISLTHHLRLGPWIWAGNLLVLAFLIPMWKSMLPQKPFVERLWLFLPVVWVVMSLNYAETLDFAVSGLQVVLVLTLCLTCIYLASQPDETSNLWSCALAFLACATYANGFMMSPLGLPFFAKKGKWHLFCLWSFSYAAVLIPYLYRYQFKPHPRAPLGAFFVYLLTLVGSAFGFHEHFVLAALFGAVLLAAFAYATLRRFDRDNPFAYWAAVWLVLGFLLTAYGRAGSGIVTALVSRYKIYCDLFLAMLYLMYLPALMRFASARQKSRPILVTVLVMSIAFGLFSDALGYYRLHLRRGWLTYGMDHYIASGGTESPMTYTDHPEPWMIRPGEQQQALDLLNAARREGIYQIPSHY